MKFNIETLNQYKEDGWLINQSHPSFPLLIWNYSQKTQYEGFWDEITIAARGLVTDLDGNVISKGFPKFWNIEEERHVATDDFDVLEKLDGQYIGVFRYNGEMIVNSRGSFTSPYAIEAKRILEEKYPRFIELGNLLKLKNVTFCFELVGFEQIVVSYQEPDLILTGCFRRCYYEPLWNYWEDVSVGYEGEHFINSLGLNSVKKYSGLDYTNIKHLNWQNSEGFVVRFANGQRCKIKFEDYIKLHRQMTNLSTTAIWEALRDGVPVSSILNDVPDEFYDKVRNIEQDIIDEFDDIQNRVDAMTYFYEKMNWDRKTVANHLIGHTTMMPKLRSVVFSALDKKDYSGQIWNMIKPKFEKL